MIVFRQADPRYPLLREHPPQPAGRWNESGQLTHYFSDTPDGAWAEFLRHEGILDAEDLACVRRAIWAVDIGDEPPDRVELSDVVLTDGHEPWSQCQRVADALRKEGESGLAAPSAALLAGGARGWRVDSGLQPGPHRDGETIALFDPRPDLIGWPVTVDGRPADDLLDRVRPL